MYLNIQRSNRKPDSFKLIRQLKCYLYLNFQMQVHINAILESEKGIKEKHPQIPESLRTFHRYIGEIVYCVNDGIRDKDDEWIVYYSQGSFYRKDDNLGAGRKFNSYRAWINWQEHASHIQPIAPSNGHGKRLERTMFLAERIVSEYDNMESPLTHFLFDWPMKRDEIKEYCDTDWGLDPRTIQRDTGVIYEVITSYLFNKERQDVPLCLKNAQKQKLY